MPGASQGGGETFYFFIIRDRTFKHKYRYFHIYQKKKSIQGVPLKTLR